jgi:hypothetical protein
MSPPKVEFNPKTSSCRFHPNYYTTGKVCLSIINTWAGQDWSPSMSLMALLVTIEERFFERALGCEPGHENSSIHKFQQYNDFVEYNKYKTAIIDVMLQRYPIYEPFTDVIHQEFHNNNKWHIERVTQLIHTKQGHHLQSPTYSCGSTSANYEKIKQDLSRFNTLI